VAYDERERRKTKKERNQRTNEGRKVAVKGNKD
jgi:hypothetical protein